MPKPKVSQSMSPAVWLLLRSTLLLLLLWLLLSGSETLQKRGVQLSDMYGKIVYMLGSNCEAWLAEAAADMR